MDETIPLLEMPVLVLDCQTTGATPQRGALLEIAWSAFRAADDPASLADRIQSRLAVLPPNTSIPRQVTRITGITNADGIADGISPEIIWHELTAAAAKMSCPVAVIHYARFELAFLQDLHHRYDAGADFPLRVLCSHQMAQGLLPQLPRKGIRAVAGYYGHLGSPMRRSGDHVLATAVIWKHFVPALGSQFAIHTLDQLQTWLSQKRAPLPTKVGRRQFPMGKAPRENLSPGPGIYRMLNRCGDLLYVGKAKSLRTRVASYFQPSRRHPEHILEMLSQARDLACTSTETALEAALLEADEIKKKKPPYNVALRNDPHRQLAYLSPNASTLCTPSQAAQSAAVCGPFPSTALARRIMAVAQLIRNRDAALARLSSQENDLGIDADHLPDETCLRAGLDLFMHAHTQKLARHPFIAFVTALGAALWRERLLRSEQGEEAQGGLDDLPADEATDTDEDQNSWTPETVVDWLESIIRHGAHMIRRARWFRLLGESSLCFQLREGDAGKWRLLVIEKGHITARRNLPSKGTLPIPKGITTEKRQRNACFDMVTYDRLRVLTTEIRRLVGEKRPVRLRVGVRPGALLDEKRLGRLLRWI